MGPIWKSFQPETQRSPDVSVSVISAFNNLYKSLTVSGLDMSQRKKRIKETQVVHRNLRLGGHPVHLKGHISPPQGMINHPI